MDCRGVKIGMVAALLCAGFVGCGQKEKETAPKKDLDAVALAVVDGKPLTAAELRDTVLIVAKIRRMSGKKVIEKAFPRWANNAAMSIFAGMVSGRLVSDEATRLGIKGTPETDARMLAKYNKMTRQKAKSLDELAPKFKELEAPFRRQFARESQFEAYFDSIGAREVETNELTRFYSSVSNRVKMVTFSNKIARSEGQKAWEALKSGEKWEDVAKKYNEDDPGAEEGADGTVEWESFRLKDCYIKEVAEALVGLKEGDFTKPLETEGGLMIVKVLKVEEGVYTTARIYRRMMKDVSVPTQEQALATIRRAKTNKRQLEIIRDLRKKVQVDYPLGTNFVYNIWDVPTNRLDRVAGREMLKQRKRKQEAK